MRKILFIIFTMLICGISTEGVSFCADNKDAFAKGEVIIGFKESVSGQQALEILKHYGLPVKDIVFSSYTYFLKTPKRDTENHRRHLLDSRLFDVVETRLDTTDQTFDILFAYAKLDTTCEEVTTLIQGIDNLSIVSAETHAIILSVMVKAGEEEKWIKTLKNNPNIEFAELNCMAEIALD